MSVFDIASVMNSILNEIYDNDTQEQHIERLTSELKAIGIANGEIVDVFAFTEAINNHKWSRVTTIVRKHMYEVHCRTAERDFAKIPAVLANQDVSGAIGLVAAFDAHSTAASAEWVMVLARREIERAVVEVSADAMRQSIAQFQTSLIEIYTLADIPMPAQMIQQYEETLSWIK